MSLKLDIILHRQATCRACEHVRRFPFPIAERVWTCALLYNEKLPERHPAHYLVPFVQSNYTECPAKKWLKATPEDERGPKDPGYEGDEPFQYLWKKIHSPDAEWSRRFIVSILLMLPCGDCRKHFNNHCKEYPPPLHDPRQCRLWGWNLHDRVNARLGRPPFDLEQFEAKWGPLLPIDS